MNSRKKGRDARKEIQGETRKKYTEAINANIEKLLKNKQTVMVYNAIDGEVEIKIKNRILLPLGFGFENGKPFKQIFSPFKIASQGGQKKGLSETTRAA